LAKLWPLSGRLGYKVVLSAKASSIIREVALEELGNQVAKHWVFQLTLWTESIEDAVQSIFNHLGAVLDIAVATLLANWCFWKYEKIECKRLE